jgi:hypothetical protein
MESNEVSTDILSFMLRDNFDIKVVGNDERAIGELKRDRYDIFLIGSITNSNPKSEIEFIKSIYTGKFNLQMKIIVMDDKKIYFARRHFLARALI